MKVIWKTGYTPHNVDAEVAYQTVCDLHKQGKSRASDLVEASRPETAPLHPLFEWDDTAAAEKWREYQARTIIAHIQVVPDESPNSEPVRAFFNIEPEHSTPYEPTVLIMSDEGKRKRLLDIAIKELLSFQTKYRTLKELSDVFAVIDKTVQTVQSET